MNQKARPELQPAARRLQALHRHILDGPLAAPELQRTPCSVPNVRDLTGKLLQGQVAVVTGSGQGLGAAAAELFALHGAKLVVSDIDGDKAEKVAAHIRDAGGEVHVVTGDITTADFPARLAKDTGNKFGGIDILVNNAGFTWDATIHKMTKEQWDAMLAVHVTAPFRIIQAMAPYMREAAKKELASSDIAKPRSILNVSSIVGEHGNIGQANYAAAKAALLGLTKTVAKEWGAFNIRCNAVSYGFIATRLTQDIDDGASHEVGGHKVKLGIPGGAQAAAAAAEMLVPLKRVGTPAEAAGAMLALVSPLTSFVTGQSLEVNGGAAM